MGHVRTLLITGMAIAVFGTAPAAGEENPGPFVQFAACAETQDDAARLACYDGLAENLLAAVKEEDEIKKARTAAFGAEGFASKDKLEEIERVNRIISPVLDIKAGGDRRLVFTLSNGQVWRQDPNDRVIPTPDEGVEHTAEIRRVMFGRYDLVLQPEGRKLRVDRME